MAIKLSVMTSVLDPPVKPWDDGRIRRILTQPPIPSSQVSTGYAVIHTLLDPLQLRRPGLDPGSSHNLKGKRVVPGEYRSGPRIKCGATISMQRQTLFIVIPDLIRNGVVHKKGGVA